MAAMETKRKSAVGLATEGHAQGHLRRGPARTLTTEEDKVLRMRLGASPPAHAALSRAAEVDSDLGIELLAAEIEVYMKWKARQEEGVRTVQETATRPAPSPRASPLGTGAPSRTKEKIIRALRKKA
jgi:hypothetical protein